MPKQNVLRYPTISIASEPDVLTKLQSSDLLCENPDLRHDIHFLFDCAHCNPNGDPDNDGVPRTEHGTGRGVVADISLKRKIRDYVQDNYGSKSPMFDASNPDEKNGFNIYVHSRNGYLDQTHVRAYEAEKIAKSKKRSDKAGEANSESEGADTSDMNADSLLRLTNYMIRTYYDIRMFGGVLNVADPVGRQCKGPVQFTTALSVDPVRIIQQGITRVLATRTGDNKHAEMGRRSFVEYGLYRGEAFLTPALAKRHGVTPKDYRIFYEALRFIFESSRSCSRPDMPWRALVVFTHDKPYGFAYGHQLAARLKVTNRHADSKVYPTSFEDYEATLDLRDLPQGITPTILEIDDAVNVLE